MKYKNEILITAVVTILILFLKKINVLQIENGLAHPLSMLSLILLFSAVSIYIQNKIDKNKEENLINYHNLDILKYICAILIIILHLRPFQNFSNEFDLTFNNIITRICVPVFFVITGYFTAKKEKDNLQYIRKYIKNMIPTYLKWSVIYLPVIAATIIQYYPAIQNYISNLHISPCLLMMLFIIALPLALIAALLYSGVYYHLWYFPAVMLSLGVLDKWKKKYDIKYLLGISFILLLFGATETYYGVLPLSIRQMISYYYNIFFTTRNFLFFGLFYIVLGYYMGTKNEIYAKYCFEKLVISFFFLIFEAILLHDTDRLNSNILLSCIPLTYYLFISVIYMSKPKPEIQRFSFRGYSKYYYLVHPMMIFILTSLGIINNHMNPFIKIIFVLVATHLLSAMIIKVKNNQ